jgi:hypothetical protein
LWQTVKGDFSRATGFTFVGVIALLAWMAFQWGFGNDALLPPIVTATFDRVDDGSTWRGGFAGVGAAMLAGFLFWAATQAFDAVVMLCGLRLIPGITERVSSLLRRKGWVTPYDDMSSSTRWIIRMPPGHPHFA